jgi:apolipoprotein N-acyltransferase
VPFRDQLGWVEQLQLIPRNFTAGSGDAVLPVAGTRIGGVICYEVAYDDLVRSSVATGAQLLVVQTNNATYMRDGQLGETLQQLDMARVRAVEHDRAAVVASTTGISAIIAPDGSLTVTTGPWRSQVLVGTVELRETPPRSAGPWVEPLAAAVVLGVLVPMVARRRGGRVEVRPWA